MIEFEETLGHIKPKATAKTQAQAAFEVINRTIPNRAVEFSVKVNPSLTIDSKELFQVI